MPKTKKLIVIGGSELPIDNVVVKLTLADLAALLKEEKEAATRECITQLRPFVSGQLGRDRLDNIQEEYVLVEEEVVEQPEYVFIDKARDLVLQDVDFEHVFQTIRRRR